MRKRTCFIIVIISLVIYGYYNIRQPDIIAYISLDEEFHFYPDKGLISYSPPTIIGELSQEIQYATMSFSPILTDKAKSSILKHMNEAYISNSPFLFYRCIPRKNAPHTSFFVFLFSEKDIGKALQVGFNGFSFSFNSEGKENVCVSGLRKNFKISSRIMTLAHTEGALTTLAYTSPNEVLPLLDKGNATSDFLDVPHPPQIEEFELGHKLHRTTIINNL